MEGSEAVRVHVAWMMRRGLRPNTIKLRTRVLRRLEIHAGKSLLLVTLDDLRAFLDRLDDQGSRAAERSQVRSFYQWCVLEGRLEIDPSVRLESIRKRKYLPRPISDEKLAKALVAPPERVAPMLWLAAYAGLRACDIAQLRGEHLLFDHNPPMIFVEESKGGKPRTVPMAPILAAELPGRVPDYGWCFPYRDGSERPLPPHMISKLVNEYLHDMGITETLHQLRHWFVSTAWKHSHNLLACQQLAGHENPNTTKVYAWVDPGETVEIVNALPVL
jgi:integrase